MALVRVKLDDGTEVTVGAAHAANAGLTVLKKPAVDGVGRALPAKYPVDLRGAELDAALDKVGLPKSGTAAEKRERLSAHNHTSDVAYVDAAASTLGGESATSPKEDSK
jgi:hypothetical protein